MTTVAPLQAATAKPKAMANSGLLLQRKCACGASNSSIGDKCEECQPKTLQQKLSIGSSSDPLELEADRVADQVMNSHAHDRVGTARPKIQRFSGHASGDLGSAPASVDRVLASSGRPLEPALRTDMEQRFGYDFSRVRVHSGAAAERSARDVGAAAYTVGQHVVFASGRYAPSTPRGTRLLAHELGHTLQQRDSSAALGALQRAPDDAPPQSPSVADARRALDEAKEVAKDLVEEVRGGRTVGTVRPQRDTRRIKRRIRDIANRSPTSADDPVATQAADLLGQIEDLENELRARRIERERTSPAADKKRVERIRKRFRGTDPKDQSATPAPTAPKVGPPPKSKIHVPAKVQGGENAASGGGGGTLAPVKPLAHGTQGEIITGQALPPKPIGRTASGGGGGTPAPVKPFAQGTQGEIITGQAVPPKPTAATPAPTAPKSPVHAHEGSTSVLTEKAIGNELERLAEGRGRAVAGRIARVGSRAFAVVKIGGNLLVIYNLLQIRSLKGAVAFAEGWAFDTLVSAIAKEVLGGTGPAFVLVMLVNLPDDQGPGFHERQQKATAVEQFLEANFTLQEIAEHSDVLRVEAERLLFETPPFELLPAPPRAVQPLPSGTLDVAKVNEDYRLKTEAEIIRQLRLPMGVNDARASSRADWLVKSFRQLFYWSELYRERIDMRRSNDELISLLFSQISRETRARIFQVLGVEAALQGTPRSRTKS